MARVGPQRHREGGGGTQLVATSANFFLFFKINLTYRHISQSKPPISSTFPAAYFKNTPQKLRTSPRTCGLIGMTDLNFVWIIVLTVPMHLGLN
jgi:hypothetical protein